MTRRSRFALVPLALAAVLPLRAASAQIQAHVDLAVDVASGYVDRGVLLTNVPVVRPALRIGIPAGTGMVRLGVGATVQPVRFTGDSTAYPMADTAKVPNVTELRPSLALEQPFGPVRFAFVAEYRMFPNAVGITKAGNVGTVATRLGLHRSTTELGVLVGYSIGAVTGTYVDASLSQELPIVHGAALAFESRAGWSLHQETHDAPARFAAFERSGFSYLDLGAGARIVAASVNIHPYVSVTYVPHPYAAPADTPADAPAVAADGLVTQERWTTHVGVSIAVHTILPPARKK